MIKNRQYLRPYHFAVCVISVVMQLASIFYILAYNAKHQGETIATHFDMLGNPDNYGSPLSLIVLPIIMLSGVLLMVGILLFCPVEKANYPMKINPQSAHLVYRDFVLLVSIDQLLFSIFTLYFSLTYFTHHKIAAIGSYVFIAMIIAASLGSIVKMRIDNKKFI